MLKNYVPSEPKKEINYELVYDDGHNNGFGFPCDCNGKPLSMSDAARENLRYCEAHREEFVRRGEIIKRVVKYTEPAHGICKCGNEVTLTGNYYGADECHKCGRWYNIYGQELLPPEEWETDPNEEEYW